MRVSAAVIFVLTTGCWGSRSTDYWLNQLTDADLARRREAVRELAGHDPERVVPALAACLRDENHYVRHDAAVALGKFGPAAASAAPALRAARKDRERSIREAVEAALKKIDPGRG